MDLLFVRHGQTFWNVENKICGQTDIALTPLGYRQAEQVADRILAEKKLPDVILTSPLTRAYETALVKGEVKKQAFL